jgi:uncharacterized protein YjbI with pentapeptide repeats
MFKFRLLAKGRKPMRKEIHDIDGSLMFTAETPVLKSRDGEEELIDALNKGWAAHHANYVLKRSLDYADLENMMAPKDAVLQRMHARGALLANATIVNRKKKPKPGSLTMDVDGTMTVGTFDLAIFTGATLEDSDFSYGSFQGATMDHCNMQKTDFSHSDFSPALVNGEEINTTLDRSDLTLANFRDSDVTGVDFHECIFKNTNMRDVRGLEKGQLTPEQMAGCLYLPAAVKERAV